MNERLEIAARLLATWWEGAPPAGYEADRAQNALRMADALIAAERETRPKETTLQDTCKHLRRSPYIETRCASCGKEIP